MRIFLFLCCLFSAAELATHRGDRFLCAVLVLLFLCIVASRDVLTVPDTSMYVDVYELVSLNIQHIDTSFETGYMLINYVTGYMLINYVSSALGMDYRLFLMLTALIPCVVYLYAISMLMSFSGQRKFYCVSFSVYAVFWGLVGSGIIMRIGIAIPFAFLAHVFMLRKKFLKSVLTFFLAFSFHTTIIVYPLFLFLSSMIRTNPKHYDIYWGGTVFMWFATMAGYMRYTMNGILQYMLGFIAGSTHILAKYEHYLYSLYDSSSSRKNILFLILLFFFVKARPVCDKFYDHWLRFFAFNMLLTFSLSTFVVGYRVSDIPLISVLPMFMSLLNARKFHLDIKLSICTLFIVSMSVFSLRMTGVY